MQFNHSLKMMNYHKIWNIIEIAMEREGYDVQNAELSMRLYDPELTENKEYYNLEPVNYYQGA